MRRALAALILFLLLAPLPGSQLPRPPDDRSGTLQAKALVGVKAGQRFGALTLVEAWELTSPDSRFGGLSGLIMVAPRRFLAVSDRGQFLEFTLASDGRVSAVRFFELDAKRGKAARKRLVDAEAVTRDPQTGRFWLSLEGSGVIRRYGPDGRRQGVMTNPVLRQWPANGGAESLVRLSDGRFMVLSERFVRQGHREGLILSADPFERGTKWFRFRYDSGDLGAPTDAAALPDGRALVLHRKIGAAPLFRASIAVVDPRGLTPGATLVARPIARLADDALAENYEGMTVQADGEPLSLWLVSDNNQNDWQRTLLLHFRIDPAVLADSKKGGTASGPP